MTAEFGNSCTDFSTASRAYHARRAQVYIDFFVLSRADALVSNCNGESTYIANAKLLRDGTRPLRRTRAACVRAHLHAHCTCDPRAHVRRRAA